GTGRPSAGKAHWPPRGPGPTGAVLLGTAGALADTGTVTSFCVVNVPFLGQRIPIPYVAANIVVDGADIAFSHLVQEVEADQVRMGMRVQAVWRPRDDPAWGPSLENIDHFRPTGEPDAPFESYGHHL